MAPPAVPVAEAPAPGCDEFACAAVRDLCRDEPDVSELCEPDCAPPELDPFEGDEPVVLPPVVAADPPSVDPEPFAVEDFPWPRIGATPAPVDDC